MKRIAVLAVIPVVLILHCLSCALTDAAVTKSSASSRHDAGKVIQEFWVSPAGSDTNPGTETRPFATIKQAQTAVRKINKEEVGGIIRVWLEKGVYTLTEPLTFGSEDGGTSSLKVIYEGRPGQKVIISGGRTIDGWQREEGTVWAAHIQDVEEGKWFFRDLYAGTERLTRARWPNPGQEYLKLKDVLEPNRWQTSQQFVFTSAIPAGNLGQQDAEAVFLLTWSIARKLIHSSDETSITTEFPTGWRGHTLCEPSTQIETRVFLENARAFLDQPGEWYLDRDTGILRLKLEEGQTPEEMTIVAPRSEQLLTVAGTPRHPVLNLHFEGIHLRYANWRLPLAGYNGIQAGVHGMRYIDDPAYMLPAAVYWEYARQCSLTRSEIACTGASGIALGAGCRDNRVVGCRIYNIGGNGVVVGWRPVDYKPPRRHFETDWQDPADVPLRNRITDNRIYRCGQVQFGAVGYSEMFAAETVCAHNAIYDLPYSGISLGFTWNHAYSAHRGSRVEYNHIYDVMQTLHDGAGIYTLGYQAGTVIRNNLIEDVHLGHGLYTDEGSSRILMENNIVHRAGIYGYQHHYGHSNIVRNNIFASSGKYAVFLLREIAKPSFQFERNIVWMDRHKPIAHPWYAGRPEDEGEILREGQTHNLFVMDRNLYWDARDRDVKFGDLSLSQWQEQRGQDKHSIVVDPMFHDPEKGDFTLPEDSPAIQKIGFKPIDVNTVGPRIQTSK